MRTLLGLSLVLLLAISARAADATDADKTAKEMLKGIGEVTTLLEGITDEKSADAAIPKLKKQMSLMKERSQKIEKLPKEDQDQLKKKHMKEFKAAVTKMATALQAAIKKVPTRAKEIGGVFAQGRGKRQE
jgi:DNA mismatch repair ATPase MutS